MRTCCIERFTGEKCGNPIINLKYSYECMLCKTTTLNNKSHYCNDCNSDNIHYRVNDCEFCERSMLEVAEKQYCECPNNEILVKNAFNNDLVLLCDYHEPFYNKQWLSSYNNVLHDFMTAYVDAHIDAECECSRQINVYDLDYKYDAIVKRERQMNMRQGSIVKLFKHSL